MTAQVIVQLELFASPVTGHEELAPAQVRPRGNVF